MLTGLQERTVGHTVEQNNLNQVFLWQNRRSNRSAINSTLSQSSWSTTLEQAVKPSGSTSPKPNHLLGV